MLGKEVECIVLELEIKSVSVSILREFDNSKLRLDSF